MTPRRLIAAASFAMLVGTIAPTTILAAQPGHTVATYKTYANCTALNKVYPHGVGKPGAVDHTSGAKVRNFYVSLGLYQANRGSDRDKDGIACEKR